MNYILSARIFLIYLNILFAWQGITAQPLWSVTYYELIGLDQGKLYNDAFTHIQTNKEYLDVNKEWEKAKSDLQSIPITEQKQLESKKKEIEKLQKSKEKIREKIEAKFLDKEIRKACHEVDKEYRKELEKLTEDDYADQKEIEALQKKVLATSFACAVLTDAQKRRDYNNQLLISGEDVFENIQNNLAIALSLAPDRKILLNDIATNMLTDLLEQFPIPRMATKLFNQNIAIRNLSILPRPTGYDVRYGVGFTGLIELNNFEVRLSVYIIQDPYGDRKVSLVVELPKTYKISDLFPQFSQLDAFQFPQAKFTFANFEGVDSEGFPFKKGLNFGALLDLSGPLQILNDLKEKASVLQPLVFESRPIILHGVIPFNLAKVSLKAQVPLYIGVDLRKISIIPKIISDTIQQITTDGFELAITPVKKTKTTDDKELSTQETKEKISLAKEFLKQAPLGFEIKAETGIRIILGTQTDPISFTSFGSVIPINKQYPQGLLTVGGGMKGMLQFGWFAFGDVIVTMDFDGALMPVAAIVGLPFTGLGIRGQLDLGKEGESRATLKVAGGFKISSSVIPIDPLLELSGENIRFADLVGYASKLAAQAKILETPIEIDRIPTMTLHKIWGYCALKNTRIGGKQYPAGFGFQVDVQLFDRKAGMRIFINDKFVLSGGGYFPHLNIDVKGQPVFLLYGLTPDKGPRIGFNFDPKEPLQGAFKIEGTIHIPPIGVKQAINLSWQRSTINADFETELAGFSIVYGLRLNTHKAEVDLPEVTETEVAFLQGKKPTKTKMQKPQDKMNIKFGFKGGFGQVLNEKAVPAMRKVKHNALKKIDQLNEKIIVLQKELVGNVEDEITKVNESIAQKQKKIALLQVECSKLPFYKQVACRANISAQQVLLMRKKAYLQALLKPGKSVVKQVTKTAAKLAKELAQSKTLRLITETILEGMVVGLEMIARGINFFNITEVLGEYSWQDIVSLKLPKLVRLVAKVDFIPGFPLNLVLENLQFDLKHPLDSLENIGAALLLSFIESSQNKYLNYAIEVAA